MTFSSFFKWTAGPCLLSFALLAGCGPSGPAQYAVTGKVTFNGKPVKEGSVTFEDPATGISQKADLENGAYKVELQEGAYKVCVEPILIVKEFKNSPPDYVYKPAPDIPGKYHSTFESGLTHQVTGAGEYDIDMK